MIEEPKQIMRRELYDQIIKKRTNKLWRVIVRASLNIPTKDFWQDWFLEKERSVLNPNRKRNPDDLQLLKLCSSSSQDTISEESLVTKLVDFFDRNKSFQGMLRNFLEALTNLSLIVMCK